MYVQIFNYDKGTIRGKAFDTEQQGKNWARKMWKIKLLGDGVYSISFFRDGEKKAYEEFKRFC